MPESLRPEGAGSQPSLAPVGPSGRFRGWAHRLFQSALEDNARNIERALMSLPPGGVLLDLGCDDGANTVRFAAAARAREVHGLEIVEQRMRLAAGLGIRATRGDLNEPFPYDADTFDIVVSNQVIEHLVDTDNFIGETYRVLRPGGCAVVSTENLSSWHNTISLILGWQPFSLTNVTQIRLGLGNPLAIHRGEDSALPSWQHIRVFAPRGLHELLTLHGFHVETTLGAGYYPLPRALARWDARHAAFLTLKALRPGRPSPESLGLGLGYGRWRDSTE